MDESLEEEELMCLLSTQQDIQIRRSALQCCSIPSTILMTFETDVCFIGKTNNLRTRRNDRV
jgi:hypothetical protein